MCINCTCMHNRRNLELFRGKTVALLKLSIHDTHTLIFKSEARANLHQLCDTSTAQLLWFGGPALQQGKHSGRKKKVSLAPFSNSCNRAKTLWKGQKNNKNTLPLAPFSNSCNRSSTGFRATLRLGVVLELRRPT